MNEPKTIDVPSEPATPQRSLRWIRWLVLISAVFALVLGSFGYYSDTADQQLQEAIAEADRLDPGWRLEELEARRAKLPDEANSFRLVRSLSRRLPDKWWEPFAEKEAILAEARKLADMPHGQFTHPWDTEALANYSEQARNLGAELASVEKLSSLLIEDANRLTREGKPNEALASCRAAVNVGRSIGDHPSYMGQDMRLMCIHLALVGMDNTLARGEPEEPALAPLQRLLQEEERHPSRLIALRGERALWHAAFSAIEAGTAPMKTAEWPLERIPPLARNMPFLMTPRSKEVHASRLRYLNELVEIAKLSVAGQDQRVQEGTCMLPLGATFNKAPWTRTAEDNAKCRKGSEAEIRCGIIMLALERYRRSNGRWPDSLAALVPRQLRLVPADPYDGAPLRYRRCPGSVVVYSIGPNGKDDGGDLMHLQSDREWESHPVWELGSDRGFHLWDPELRRPVHGGIQ